MKTKHLILVLFVTSLNMFQTYAQKFYVTAGGGYAFSAPGNIIGHNFLAPASENVYGTYGKGISTCITIGYMISENIDVETGYSHLKVAGYELKSEDSRYPGYLYLSELNAKMSRIFCDIKIAAGKNIRPYCKFGFAYGVGIEVTIDDVTVPYAGSDKYSGGSAPGFFGAVGADIKLMDKLFIFCEGNILYQNYSPSKQEGWDMFSAYSYDLVDEWNTPTSNQRLKTSFPFSSIGINVGVKYLLGKSKDNLPITK